MTKKQFLKLLNKRLKGLSKTEKWDRISFYSEMIDDRVEEGISEADAINAIGAVDDVAKAIIFDVKAEKRYEKDSRSTTRTVLIACGFPIWLPLLVSLYAILFSLLVAYLSLVISLWAAFMSVAVASPASILVGIYVCCAQNILYGMVLLSGGIICGGLAILLYFASLYLTRMIPFTVKILFKWTKIFFKRKVRV